MQLELLRPLWPDYDLWVVQGVRPAPDVYCAGRKGTPAACVNAGVLEVLAEPLARLAQSAG